MSLDLANSGVIRKKRTAPLRQHSAPPALRRSSASADASRKASQGSQSRATRRDANDKAAEIKETRRPGNGGSALDGSYEDDLVEALRLSKIEAVPASDEKGENKHGYDEEASLQKALRLSEKEVRIGDRADGELQYALERSRCEQGGSAYTHDPDLVGESSGMGAMRNGLGDAAARGLLPDQVMDEWTDPSEEPHPPYVP